jgi:hypothetical protein
MRPPPFAAGLREAGAGLAGANVEPPCPLQLRQVFGWRAGAGELFPGERRQANGLDELRPLIAKRLKKIHQLRVDVIVGLDRIRADIHEHGRRAAIDIAEMRRVLREKGRKKIQVRELAAVPAEGDQTLRLSRGYAATCSRGVDRRSNAHTRAPDAGPLSAIISR